jgi:hypothetical protein
MKSIALAENSLHEYPEGIKNVIKGMDAGISILHEWPIFSIDNTISRMIMAYYKDKISLDETVHNIEETGNALLSAKHL